MKSQILRNSAKGQDCAFKIPNVCNCNPETVVLCHLPDISGTGKMGGKSPDWIAAFGCHACHEVIDNRAKFHKAGYNPEDRDYFIRVALLRTWKKWIEMGLVTIEGMK